MFEDLVTYCYAVVKEQQAENQLSISDRNKGQKSKTLKVLDTRSLSSGGDERNRTADFLLAREALSHLSYIPKTAISNL